MIHPRLEAVALSFGEVASEYLFVEVGGALVW